MEKLTVVTPENIELDYELAGLGSRMVAVMVDHLLQFGLIALIALSILVADPSLAGGKLEKIFTSVHIAIFTVLTFLIMFGYFIFFETIWTGQTPGKKAAQIQVIRENGEPVGFIESLIRNVFRIIDFLPFYYLLGIIVIFLTEKNQRIGDLVGKTLVVRLKDNLAPTVMPELRIKTDLKLNISGLTGEDYGMVRDFIMRRDILSIEHRERIGKKLASAMAEKMGMDPDVPDPEEFLEAVAVEYRNLKKNL